MNEDAGRKPPMEKMIDGQPCGKTKCLKETNPDAENPKFRGQFIGKPFIYEECWHSCYLCNLESENKEDI